MKVEIVPQTGKMKTIKELGEEPTLQTFERGPNDKPTIFQYLQSKNRLSKVENVDIIVTVQNSSYPCVNVGTRQKKPWFPAECVRIVEHQRFKIQLSKDATRTRIVKAREDAGDSPPI